MRCAWLTGAGSGSSVGKSVVVFVWLAQRSLQRELLSASITLCLLGCCEVDNQCLQ